MSNPIPVIHRDRKATGLFDPDGMKITLLAGSILTIDLSRNPPSNIAGNYGHVQGCVNSGAVRTLNNGTLEVLRDIPNLSPSEARVFADGKVGSGWLAWHLKANGALIDSLRTSGGATTPSHRSTSQGTVGSSPVLNAQSHGIVLPQAIVPPTPLPTIIQSLVAGIQQDPYNPPRGRPMVCGWDNRIRTYTYATRNAPVAWPAVYGNTAAMITGLRTLVAAYNWNNVNSATSLSHTDFATFQQLAEQVCTWGGVRQQGGYAEVWKVIKSAVLGARCHAAPLNSGWTKVASFATDGRPNAQTIWDSRVSTSLIWRLDKLLHSAGLNPSAILTHYPIGLVAGRANAPGKPRARHYLLQGWPKGYGKWPCHFAGGQLVRDIVDILNDPALSYPPMPLPSGGSGPWDVFGVGLVLFMDGY